MLNRELVKLPAVEPECIKTGKKGAMIISRDAAESERYIRLSKSEANKVMIIVATAPDAKDIRID